MILHWPLPAVYQRITSTHGPTGNDGKPHTGIDISCPVGVPVYAAHAGTVRYEWTQKGGNCMRLTAPTGEYTRYCHLSSYTADDYEQVAVGDEIARSGNSGAYTTGAHLHWEYHLADGTAVDPLKYLRSTMSKLSLHFQMVTDWAGEVTSRYWPYRTTGGWVKVIDPPAPDAFPDTKILGRSWLRPDNNTFESDCVAAGADGGIRYFEYHRQLYESRRGIVTAWEFVNEPILQTIHQAYQYTDALNAWNGRMHANGFKTCGGCISVGNPRLAAFGEDNQIVAILAPALHQCDYWSYHAYWNGRYNPADNWWAHRYRLIVDAAKGMGITLPPLILSECGCDKGGGINDGWRARMSWADYWADLQAFDREICKDSYVLAATIFTCGPTTEWRNFEIDKAQAEVIGRTRLGEVTPPAQQPHEGLPTDETATDAKTLVQKSRWWLEEEQRQREAGNTAYAERIRLALIQLLYRAERAF